MHNTYWEERKGLNYYKTALELSSKFAPKAKSVIDVGAGRTTILNDINWIDTKVAIDLERKPTVDNALNIYADFMKYQPKIHFDLVICLQVLEHLHNPKEFMQKLLSTGKVVIISVPYFWSKDYCEYHIQDPISEEKVLGWAGKKWLYYEIVEDLGRKRLVAVFKGEENGLR